MKTFLLVFITSFFFFDSNWSLDFDKAKSTAQAEQKLILLNFSGSDWCGPCIKLKKEVLESAEFLNFAKTKLVMVKADFPRLKKNQLPADQVAKNEKLAEKYNSKGKFPYTLLIDSNGNVLKEWDGYGMHMNPQSIISEISALAK